jgi:pantoate--beta-alanine ligase
MRVITTVREMLGARTERSLAGTWGLVPTMGYLHEGHLSLVRQARRESDVLAVSIFVNPAQFGPREDLTRYPRDLPRDLHLLEACGVDVVFAPGVEEMYPPGFTTYIDPGGPLVAAAEGASRPGHFRGVATVVLKLFQILDPHRAYFGQKDAQQVAVLARMVADFCLPVALRIAPTVREADGLAMSSRNAYLTPQLRPTAGVLYQALLAGKRAFEEEEQASGCPAGVIDAMQQVVAGEPLVRLDYVDVRDPGTFLPLEHLRAPALLLIAAFLGSTRLIDNVLLRADGSWETGILKGQQ